MATVSFDSPFELLTRPLTLKPRNRKPLDLGPALRPVAVHLGAAADETGLAPLIEGRGLRDRDGDGLKEQDTNPSHMWQSAWSKDLAIEFELAEASPLAAIEVWNYNAEWQTTNGVRRADVSVSADGTTWQTVLQGAEFAEAEDSPDYDQPTVLKLNGVAARKVRFDNVVPRSDSGRVGLSAVIFHKADDSVGAEARVN